MKKISTVLLLITLIVSNLLFGVSADDVTVKDSEETLKTECMEVFQEAFEAYQIITKEQLNSIDEKGNSTAQNFDSILSTEKYRIFDNATDGSIYPDTGYSYDKMFYTAKYNFNGKCIEKYEDLKKYVSESFTADFSNKMFKHIHFALNTGVEYKFEDFRPGDNGEILIRHNCFGLMYLYKNKVGGYTGEFSVSGSTAKLGVYVKQRIYKDQYEQINDKENLEYGGTEKNGDVFYYKKVKTTVEFENTANGWRVSGGDFFEVFESLAKVDNPSTGSPTPIYLALAGAAVLCALPVVKRKRRI